MTSAINNKKATANVNKDGVITLQIGTQKLTLTADEVTSVVTAALAARKEAYGLKRSDKKAAKAAKTAARVAKLQAQLAALNGDAAPATA